MFHVKQMKKIKKIVCIDPDGQDIYLTMGKAYDVISEDKSQYTVEDDYGFKITLLKLRFEDMRKYNLNILLD